MIVRYTEKEIQFIKDNFREKGNTELAKILGRSPDAIKHQLKRFGLKRSPEEVVKLRKQYNAGQFKPNHKPHNTKYNGYERISKDGYIEVRIKKGVFRLKHLVEWEKLNGKLPKSHCLKCVDGNVLNTNPDNWKLISRADNMLNNVNREKAGKSLKAKWDVYWHLNQLGIRKSWFMTNYLKKVS